MFCINQINTNMRNMRQLKNSKAFIGLLYNDITWKCNCEILFNNHIM